MIEEITAEEEVKEAKYGRFFILSLNKRTNPLY